MAYEWIVDGKIGCHFPERGEHAAVNFDVKRIVYSDDGNQNNIKEIESVYYVDAAAAAAILAKSTLPEQIEELHKWTIWHRYWSEVQNKKLIFDNNEEDNYVKIFELQNDATVSAIRIFANNANDAYNLTACLIDYNTGLTVGYGSTETKSQTQETLYDATGYYRTISLNSDVRLKALTKYYIGYLRPDNNKIFNNSYDEVTPGTVKTTGFANLQQTVSDIYDKSYIGTLTGTSCQRINQVMSANNTILLCTSKPTDTPFDIGQVYGRNPTYSARSWYGICDGQNYQGNTRPVLSALKNMSAGQLGVANKLSWDQNDGYYLFERTNVEIPSTECTANITANSQEQRTLDLAHFIRDNLYWPSDESVTSRTFENQTSIEKYWTWVSTLDVGVYSTNNTKYVIGNLDGLENPPDSPIENGLYLKTGSWGGIGNWGNPDILQYKNGSWQNFDPATLFDRASYEYTATFNEINNGWTAIGTSNTALMNASSANGKDGYFKLIKTDGTSIEV